VFWIQSSKISKVRQAQGAARKESEEFRVLTMRRMRADAEKASGVKRKRAAGDDGDDGDEEARRYAKFMHKAKIDALSIATPTLRGKERRDEEARLRRLEGALPPATERFPPKLRFAIDKKNKELAVEKRVRAQELGVYVKPVDERKRAENIYEKHRRLFDRSGLANTVGSGERQLKPHIGRTLKNGMVHISKREIERVEDPIAFAAKHKIRDPLLRGEKAKKRPGNSNGARKFGGKKKMGGKGKKRK
jgi:hypothetical protein